MNDTRILYRDDTTIIDFTTELSRYNTGTAVIPDFIAAEDALYIGSRHPLNGFYLRMGSVVNAVPAVATVSYWAGKSRLFFDVVELIDETDGLAQTGFYTFVPNKDESWSREDTSSTSGGSEIPELNSVRIYDRYWAKIVFDVDLTANIELSFVGNKFSDDDELGTEYPDLDRQTMRDAFDNTVGAKLDWDEQQVRAADLILRDLVAKGIINHKNQIITREELRLASVCKNAEIIYAALGDDYVDDKKAARNEYNSRLAKGVYKTDLNKNARLDVAEESRRTGFMAR